MKLESIENMKEVKQMKLTPKKQLGKPAKTELKCAICKAAPTHVVLLELRERPGPPVKSNDVINIVCEEHINKNFDSWVPYWAFKKLCIDWKNQGFILNKEFCTIKIEKLENK